MLQWNQLLKYIYDFNALNLTMKPTSIGLKFGDIQLKERAFIFNGLDFQKASLAVEFHSAHCGLSETKQTKNHMSRTPVQKAACGVFMPSMGTEASSSTPWNPLHLEPPLLHAILFFPHVSFPSPQLLTGEEVGTGGVKSTS